MDAHEALGDVDHTRLARVRLRDANENGRDLRAADPTAREEREVGRDERVEGDHYLSCDTISVQVLGQVGMVEEVAQVVAFLRRRADHEARVVGRKHASRAVQVGVV